MYNLLILAFSVFLPFVSDSSWIAHDTTPLIEVWADGGGSLSIGDVDLTWCVNPGAGCVQTDMHTAEFWRDGSMVRTFGNVRVDYCAFSQMGCKKAASVEFDSFEDGSVMMYVYDENVGLARVHWCADPSMGCTQTDLQPLATITEEDQLIQAWGDVELLYWLP